MMPVRVGSSSAATTRDGRRLVLQFGRYLGALPRARKLSHVRTSRCLLLAYAAGFEPAGGSRPLCRAPL